MPRVAALAVAAVLVGVLGACGATAGSGTATNADTAPESTGSSTPERTTSETSTPSGTTGSPVASPTGSVGATEVSATRRMCLEAFPDERLLSWADGTVADFRGFQFGGPTPARPLATVFKGVPTGTKGAWCGISTGPDTVRWWAVVESRTPVKAVDITGPGEGSFRGEAVGPPILP